MPDTPTTQTKADADAAPLKGTTAQPLRPAPVAEPKNIPPDALLLPSEHVDYVALMENELHNRVHGLQSGIAALEGVLSGKQQKHDADIAEQTAIWEAEKAALLRRIDNLKTALRMAKSGVAAKDVPQ